MTNQSDQKLLNILKSAVTRHDEFYNEDIITYILQTINPECLLEKNLQLDFGKALIHTNFWGFVCDHVIKCDRPQLLERKAHKHTPQLEESVEKFNVVQTTYQERKNNWYRLLSTQNPLFTTSPLYNIEKQERVGELSYTGMFALKEPCEWAYLYNINSDKWKITDQEQLFVINSFFYRYNEHNASYLTSEESNILLNMFIKHQQDVKQNYIGNNKIKAEDGETSWIEYIMGAPMFCELLNNASKEQLSMIFNDSSYKLLINKATLKINVEHSPEMLSNILGIAAPEQWINSYTKNGNFNLLNFFENKFKKSYAESLINKSFKSNHMYLTTRKYLLEELDYLAPALKNAKIADKDRLKFWTIVVNTRNIELIIKVCKALELPNKDNIDNQKFYELCQNSSFKNENKEVLSFDDLYKTAQCEWLDSLIPNKNQEVKKKKIKI